MKRILVLLLVLLVSLSMMTSCTVLNGAKNDEAEETGNDQKIADDVEEIAPEAEEKAVEEITVDEEIAVDEETSDAKVVEAFALLMNSVNEEENVYVEASGTEIAMIYVFEDEYDEAMIEIMAPILEEQLESGDFYATYVSVKSELPELTAFTVEFVTADGTIVYSRTYDDNYEADTDYVVEEAEIEVPEVETDNSDDAEMVALIVDYVKESGALDEANASGVATFDVYAEGTVICMEVKLSAEVASMATESDYEMLGEIVANSIDFEEFKSLCPALSGINVYIVDESGNLLSSYEFN